MMIQCAVTEQKISLAAQLSDTCQQVFNGGYTPGKSGNISARISGHDLLITPSGWSFCDIHPEHIVCVSGEKTCTLSPDFSTLTPSSELPIHQAIYQVREDIGAIIHAHPPKATSFAVAGLALDQPIIPELTASLDVVPIIPYKLPGSDELAALVAQAFEKHQAILLANHGVITTGKTLKDAFFNLQLLESYAEIVLNCKQLGQMNVLDSAQVQDIYKLRDRMLANHPH